MENKMNTYELLYMCHMGDRKAEKCIVDEYRRMAEGIVAGSLSSQYGITGVCRDDLVQEALIGVTDAIDMYRQDKDASFRTFAALVVRRRVWKMVKHYKTIGFGTDDSLDASVVEDIPLADIIPSPNRMLEPEYACRFHVAESNMNEVYESLSPKEKAIYKAWQDGCSYKEGAKRFNCTQRSFEGRLRRVKQKVKDALQGYDQP